MKDRTAREEGRGYSAAGSRASESRAAGPQAEAAGAGDSALSALEMSRYRRQLVLPEVGVEGQLRLKAARVVLVGVGGLGAPVLSYLAAAGVGRLGLVDFDVVDATNLQRQVIFGHRDLGRPKTEAARDRVRDLNPEIEIVLHPTRLVRANALDILSRYDIVVDGCDNFPTRYLMNDACLLLGKPYVHGSVLRFAGQASVFGLPEGPCYRCLYPVPPRGADVTSPAEAGLLGVLPGIVGAIEAGETIKLILGRGDTLRGRLLLVDARDMRFRELRLERNPDCPLCGVHRTITQLVDYDSLCGMPEIEPTT